MTDYSDKIKRIMILLLIVICVCISNVCSADNQMPSVSQEGIGGGMPPQQMQELQEQQMMMGFKMAVQQFGGDPSLVTPEVMQSIPANKLQGMMQAMNGGGFNNIEDLVHAIPDNILQSVTPGIMRHFSPPGSAHEKGIVVVSEEINRNIPQIMLEQEFNKTVIINNGDFVIQKVIIVNKSNLSNQIVQKIVNKYLKVGDKYQKNKLENTLITINLLQAGLAGSQLVPDKGLICIVINPIKEVKSTIYQCNYGTKKFGLIHYGVGIFVNNIDKRGTKISYINTYDGQDKEDFNNHYVALTYHNNINDSIDLEYEQAHFKLNEEYEFLGIKGTNLKLKFTYNHMLHKTNANTSKIFFVCDYRCAKTDMGLINSNYDMRNMEYGVGYEGYFRNRKQSFYVLDAVHKGNTYAKTSLGEVINDASGLTDNYIRNEIKLDYNYKFDKKFAFNNRTEFMFTSCNTPQVRALLICGMNGVRAYNQRDIMVTDGYIMRNELQYILPQDNHFKFSVFHEFGGGRTAKFGGKNVFVQGYGVSVSYINTDNFYAQICYARAIGKPDERVFDRKGNDRLWFITGIFF